MAKARATKAPQIVERLELGSGPRRKVCTIELDGETVRTRAGAHGDAPKVVERSFASKELARAAFDKDLAARRAKGYKAPPAKALPVGALSRKGVSARNPEIEALVEEDPNNVESYLVYADWLQGEGDPRGELIGVQEGLARTPKSERLREAEQKLLKDYRSELLGPLARYTIRRLWDSYTRSFEWFCGFIRKAEFFEARTSVPLERLTAMLVGHPSGRFVQHLILTAQDGGAVLRALPPLPKTLAVLDLRGPIIEPRITLPSEAFASHPHMRRLELNHATIDFRGATFEHLRELALSGIPNPGSLLSLSQARFPRLERLEYVYWDLEPSWAQANTTLLGSALCESLHTLSITSRIEAGSLDALLRSRLVGRVRRFELASSWSADHLTALMQNAPHLARLEEVVLRSTSGSVPAAKKEAVREALPNARWA